MANAQQPPGGTVSTTVSYPSILTREAFSCLDRGGRRAGGRGEELREQSSLSRQVDRLSPQCGSRHWGHNSRTKGAALNTPGQHYSRGIHPQFLAGLLGL